MSNKNILWCIMAKHNRLKARPSEIWIYTLSEFWLRAVMFLQIYTIVCAEIRIHQTSAWTGPRMCCTNSLHERKLVQFTASRLKSEKLRKVLSGCLEKLTHGWSLGYSDLPSGNSEASLGSRAAPWDFPPASHSGNPSEQPCFLGRLQIYPRVNLSILGTTLG